MTQVEITEDVKKHILSHCYHKNGNLCVELPSSRLNFRWEYIIEKFTKKQIKVYWINGRERVNEILKVYKGKAFLNESNHYALVARDWQFILRMIL